MKIELQPTTGPRIRARLPYEGAEYVVLSAPCPSCDTPAAPIAGKGVDTTTHSTHEAEAIATCCGARVGRLIVTLDTLFGIEEDNRVLNGPWRVY